jgi:hypothetical protein
VHQVVIVPRTILYPINPREAILQLGSYTLQETHIEQLKSVRSEVLEACELEQVPLPRSDDAEDESEPMDVDSGEPSEPSLKGTGIDYSGLGRKYQQVNWRR